MAENDKTAASTTTSTTTSYKGSGPASGGATTGSNQGGTKTGSGQAQGTTQKLKDSAGKLTDQASGKARDYATQGKAKAAGALEEFSRLMNDAAGSVDDKLGAQYGDYARSAARSLSGFSQSLDAKDVDELLDNARDFVRKSPAVAIGTAAAIGFVLARLVKSGLDAADTNADSNRA